MLTNTTEYIKKLENKIADLEEELRNADKARAALLKINDEHQAKIRKQKATIGILRRAILILNDPEED